ncbi:MAG: carboxyltransferase domain-containing protein [Gordonia sp. (in: high G+C Gram-positive bacteria)]|uniref:5-oxoprolinase subunit B family protein n=1 Tax=Gordonia sp. (in: high G+C Gram-positive bacteria) TaxID=84139 RepID=UPI0039E6B05C
MRFLPAGDDAVLLDLTGADDAPAVAAALARSLWAAADSGVLTIGDVVPAGGTVLVQAPPGRGLDVAAVRRLAATVPTPGPGTDGPAGEVTIPVVYDGADLAEVAALAGVTADEVVDAHTGVEWRVEFLGFAPGFGYLVPVSDDPRAAVLRGLGRREQSRPAVPAGAVAVAAGYSAVYPRRSPGGWYLLGRTETPMWDADADPPALLSAGTRVRFTCVR